MGNYDYLANANDGFLRSSSAEYSKARAGAGDDVTIEVINDNNELHAGQWEDIGKYWLTQAFQQFDYAVPSENELVTSAVYKVHGLIHTPTGDPWSLEVRTKDWGGTVEAADWEPGADIPNNPLIAQFPEIRTRRPMPWVWRSGSAAFRERMKDGTTSPLRLFLTSNKQWLNYLPGGNHNEWVSVGAFEYADGPYRPRVNFSTVSKSTLTHCQGASTQLTDGTHVYLEFDPTTEDITLKHETAGDIATLTYGLDIGDFLRTPGAQAFALCRDANDNIFVIGPSGSEVSGIVLQAFVKQSGYSWAERGGLAQALPTYDEPVNNCAITYHTNGQLVAVVGRTQGSTMDGQSVILSLSRSNALNGGGTAIVQSRLIEPQYQNASINTSGNGMDILAVSGGTGFIVFNAADHDFGEQFSWFKLFKYAIGSNGTFTINPVYVEWLFGAGSMDGNSVARIIPISTNRFAAFCGGRIFSFSFDGTNHSVTGSAYLPDLGLATLANDQAQPWDVLYDPATKKVWIYYLDQADSRRLMRTGFNPSTGLASGEEVEVATLVGPSGSTNVAIRIPRGTLDERSVLIHVGNRAGDGTLTTQAITDTSLNQVPNTPVLTNPGSFTAQQPKTFSWSFSDNNPKDTQSAFELEIRDASDLLTAHSTGKVTLTTPAYILAALTLSNSETYEWRVRTYDKADNVSAWSNWQTFSTVTTGIVTITEPATDNLEGHISPSLTVEWDFTITSPLTQANYRVRVLRTDNADVVFNSGFLNGPEVRSYTVQGLISDVEQRIEVVVEDSSGALSNTATRLVTPSFSAPAAPTILVQPNESETNGSGILVTVINPESTGDLPPAGRNDIYRSEADEENWIKVGEAAVNGTFTDYTAASGVAYDYRVNAVAEGESTSNTVEDVTLNFKGIYLHDPTDADNTLEHFLYGSTANSDSVEALGSELRFVGRNYPVYEFGDQLAQAVGVNIVVPWDVTHTEQVAFLREIATSRKVWCFRDSRGRKVFGVISKVDIENDRVGSKVSFTVNRSEYTEELP